MRFGRALLRVGFRPWHLLTLFLTLLVVSGPSYADPELTLERIFGSPDLLTPLPASITWRADSRGISFVRKVPGAGDTPATHQFVVREVPSGKEHVVLTADTVAVPADLATAARKPFAIGAHTWRPGHDEALFVFAGDLFVLSARDGRVRRLSDTDGDEKDPVFSPDGRRITYTRSNDLYTMDLATGAEVRHTTTGSETLLNGILDWVYMEELFTRGDVRAFWWSPDGERIAFLEFDESPVPRYPIVDQVNRDAPVTFQRYPRPGDPNPIVRVGIVSASGGPVVWSDVDTRDDSYIVRVNWTGDSRSVAIEKMNRAQDHLTLYFADATTGRSAVIMEEKDDTWVNATYDKHYYQKKRQFLWGSERDGFAHLYLFNLDGSVIRQVTSGAWTVVELDGVDEKKGRVYFTANQHSVLEHHFYRIDDNGKNLTRISKEEGTHKVNMSPDRRWYIDEFNSHVRPTRVSVHNADGKHLFEIADQLGPELAATPFATPEFFTIESGGNTFNCRLIKPIDFNPTKKYPVLVFVYGGPHSQVVRKTWSRQDLWHAYMAQNGYLVFSLDNRGSAGRGKAWEEHVLKDMGNVELKDQLAGVEYLKTQAWVDPDRIGVWGWSYGGYMTLVSLMDAPGVFKAGSSVAPVTDWRLYDSIYTERYMKNPTENAAGYDAAAPLLDASKLQGSLLLMHGDADDNVHLQQSVSLARKLIDAGKDFDYMVYPQKEHGITGSADRLHLYRKMTAFFDRNLKGTPSAPVSGLTP